MCTDDEECAKTGVMSLFGTVKRTMVGGYFLLRRRRKVRTETALLFLGYNLNSVNNVLGFSEIMARLDSLISHYSRNLQHFRDIHANRVQSIPYFLFAAPFAAACIPFYNSLTVRFCHLLRFAYLFI